MSLRSEMIQKLKLLIQGRQFAYQQVFNSHNVYTHKVLKDLAKFCRAHDSAFHADPRAHAMLEGRREVWLRIERYLELSPDEVWALHSKGELDHG